MSATQEVGDIFGSGKGGLYDAMLRSPTVLIASLGLWGMNIYVFKLFSIDYVKVLNHDLIKLEEQQQQQQDQQQQQMANNNGTQQQHQQQQQHQRRFRTMNIMHNNVSNTSFDGTEMTVLDSSAMADLSTNSNSNTNSTSDTVTALHKQQQQQQHLDSDSSIVEISGDDDSQQQQRFNKDTNALNKANHEKITSVRLIGLSITLLFLLHSTYTIYIKMLGLSPIGAVFEIGRAHV